MVYNEAVADQQIIDNFNRAFAMVIALGRMETHRSLHRELIEKALMFRMTITETTYGESRRNESENSNECYREYCEARDALYHFREMSPR